MKVTIDVKGIEATKKRLANTAKKIEQSNQVVQEVAELGLQYAKNLAPEYTGALKNAMLTFPKSNESWVIISGQPAGDEGPTHVQFDLGTYPNPRRKSSLGYMKKTQEFLQTEFSERLNLYITRIIETEGKG